METWLLTGTELVSTSKGISVQKMHKLSNASLLRTWQRSAAAFCADVSHCVGEGLCFNWGDFQVIFNMAAIRKKHGVMRQQQRNQKGSPQ